MSDDIDNGDYQVDPDTELTPEDEKSLPKSVVVIPIMNSPIFPGMIAPIILSENKFTPELEQHLKSGYVALNLVKTELREQNDMVISGEKEEEEQEQEQIQKPKEKGEESFDDEHIGADDVYRVGVFCKVVKKLKLPDGSVNILVHGMKRYRISKWIDDSDILVAEIEIFEDILETDEELDAYTRSVISQVKRLSEINPYFNEEMKLAMLNFPSPGALADLVAFSISLDIPEAQDFLETLVVKKRFGKLLVYLRREKNVADIQKKISDEVSDKVNKYQKEYFLREQLKVIRSELGMDEDEKSRDIKKFKSKIEKINLSKEARKAVTEELERLENIPDSSPEYNIARTYISIILELPWDISTEDDIPIDKARGILNKDHYGLEKAKERILEFLAVRKLKPQYDGTILCLAGPPGVGKTSLGKSIASALGREFSRFSLGGTRDEAEIKGHRRTYVGAMPGRIIQALKRVKVNNPVIMLDEVDKMGSSFQGDPASALLEVLDPEQNNSFIDHYLDVPFDLSKVLFIATANYVGNIPEPLLDRMEVIDLSGYTIEEKVSIATKWVVPKQMKKHGLSKTDFMLVAKVIRKIIADYAREPGVRIMEQYIARLCRKAALKKVSIKGKGKRFEPQIKDLEELLGGAKFHTETAAKSLAPGVVTGLAWTAYGGEILSVETLPIKGEGGFKLTGQLGKVMNESATIAYSYVKKILQKDMDEAEKLKKKKRATKATARATKKAIRKTIRKPIGSLEKSDPEGEDKALDFLTEHEVHLHLPAGATPKDGPSAGISMATALYSLATNRRVKSGIAMTGELSLTGKVLPVGGIKEKVLAAKRAGIRTVILPKENVKDLKEVPERHRKGLSFCPVSHLDEVLNISFKE